ncbi:hypothetical protein NQ317_019748 [Molorchus minor]|uniref:Uncharacterized protein n=1 Tax=Molorchus minor TaxID=1323400 RepID=A0ABQ9K3Z9_9CUCU|nr:hypothetical protein NQ317_019748 [Molorchus minor]
MSGNTAMERIKRNATTVQQTIDDLKIELDIINKEYNKLLTKQLQEENARLILAVEKAKKDLIEGEIKKWNQTNSHSKQKYRHQLCHARETSRI